MDDERITGSAGFRLRRARWTARQRGLWQHLQTPPRIRRDGPSCHTGGGWIAVQEGATNRDQCLILARELQRLRVRPPGKGVGGSKITRKRDESWYTPRTQSKQQLVRTYVPVVPCRHETRNLRGTQKHPGIISNGSKWGSELYGERGTPLSCR